jgi:hypothetical protein
MYRKGVIIGLAALALSSFSSCGGSTPAQPVPVPTPKPTPVPTPTPLAAQLPPGMVCDPTPPPLYSLRLKEHNARTLDSRPQVINVDNYCARAGFGGGSFCYTRTEGDPQAAACDYLAVGKASDTGRWGPTWSLDGQPCTPTGGCTNHPDNQFLLLHYADGTYLACVSPEVPLSTDPARPGSRCGICKIKDGVVFCNEQANGL